MIVYVTRAPRTWHDGEERLWIWVSGHSTCWHVTKLKTTDPDDVRAHVLSLSGTLGSLPRGSQKERRKVLSEAMKSLCVQLIPKPSSPFYLTDTPRPHTVNRSFKLGGSK